MCVCVCVFVCVCVCVFVCVCVGLSVLTVIWFRRGVSTDVRGEDLPVPAELQEWRVLLAHIHTHTHTHTHLPVTAELQEWQERVALTGRSVDRLHGREEELGQDSPGAWQRRSVGGEGAGAGAGEEGRRKGEGEGKGEG